MTTALKTQFEITNLIIATEAKSVGLNQLQQHLLISLSQFLNDHDKKGVFICHPSHNTLVRRTGMGLSSVKRSLAMLEKLGYISSRARNDNSKVYTWLGFEADKTLEVVKFLAEEAKRVERKKALDKVRNEIWGRNTNKLKSFQQILKTSPNCENTKHYIEQIKLATKANVLYSEFQGYKDIHKVSQVPLLSQEELATYTTQASHEVLPTFSGELVQYEQDVIPLDAQALMDMQYCDRDYNALPQGF